MRAGELATMLAAQAESVAAYLLPNGRRRGTEWICGSVGGEAGESLKVCLQGSRAGLWADFATEGEKGDLIDLWASVKRQTLAEAIADVKEYLGVRDPIRPRPAHKPKPKPASPAKGTIRPPADGAVMAYLAGERGLSADTVAAFKVAELNHAKHGPCIVFPYLADGERKLIKYLPIKRDGDKKQIWTSPDSQKVLFGWQALDPNTRRVVITEGEIDAMTLHGVGIPALSIPYGAGPKQGEWIENEFDRLERFDEIYIWMDGDEAGRQAAKEICERLGIERCFIVNPHQKFKDPNAMLQGGCKPLHFEAQLGESEAVMPDHLRGAETYTEETLNELYPPNGELPGFTMGWGGSEWLRIRDAETIIVSGVNGHGKSQYANQLLLYGIDAGHRAVVASMELPARRLLARMTKQVAAMGNPSREYVESIHSWYAGRLWLYDRTGSAEVDAMFDAFEYARRRFGCDLFLIDSLMKCGIAEDDYTGQKNFIQRWTDWARDNRVTVIIVTHSRKSTSEQNMPDKFDVKGTGTITDLVDTVLTVWRNKDPEREDSAPGAMILCSKQRYSGDEGRIAAWFDSDSGQFLPFPKAKPWRFVGYSKLEGVK